MKFVLLLIMLMSILATILGMLMFYLEGPILIRIIVSGLITIPGVIFSIVSFNLFLEEL